MFKRLRADIKAIKERDPAARNSAEILLLYSGLHAIMYHRVSHWLYNHKLYYLARWNSQMAKFFTNIEIHPGAKIGTGVFLDHGTGIVIGETAEVGDNCTIYQGVTLGGTGKDKGKRHPTLCNNVMVGCGAKLLGPFTVGENSKIAANAVLLDTVPPNSTAVGVPARIVRQNGRRVCSDMDQIHIPDPVSQELCKLLMRIETLEKQLEDMKGKEHENI